MNNVEQVFRLGLCTGCGSCSTICPVNAVKIVKDEKSGSYKPVINEACFECGLCVEVCFGVGKSERLTAKGRRGDLVLGNFLNCFMGYACDSDVRYNSSSGGIVTALLIYALEERIIDGALVTKMSSKQPVDPRPFIATKRSELISAARSKYCPVPLDISLKKMLKSNGKYAIVGLPCHIYGARKVEALCGNFSAEIVFHIGLFCGGTPSFLATEYLLKKLGIKKKEIDKMDYRGVGWPGRMSIGLRNQEAKKKRLLLLPYPEYWNGLDAFFFLHRCTLCDDGFNRLADVSCGDAWLPEYRQDNMGTSLIITRNEIGEKLVKGACRKNYINIKKIEPERVKQAQKSMIRFKTLNLPIRMQMQKALGKVLPPLHDTYTPRVGKPHFHYKPDKYAFSTLFYLIRAIVSRRFLWELLEIYTHVRPHRDYYTSQRTRKTRHVEEPSRHHGESK